MKLCSRDEGGSLVVRASTSVVFLPLLLLLPMTGGCVTTPAPAEGLVSAYRVGDRGHAVFDEVVVSLRLRGVNAPYQNLHVTMTAFINPVRKTKADPYYAQGIVERCAPRIAVRLSEKLGSLPEQSLDDAEKIRQVARTESQAIIDEAMRRWEDGADYRVELAVASLYWTDPSVGQVSQGRRLWW
jgi:hypothetical protein